MRSANAAVPAGADVLVTTVAVVVLLETTLPALLPAHTDVDCHAAEMMLRTRHAAAWRVATVMALDDLSAAIGLDLAPLSVSWRIQHPAAPAVPADPNANQNAPGGI